MKKAFISHSSIQKEFVNNVAALIGHDNLCVDMLCFEPGMELNKVIKESIASANLFVIFFSSESLSSTWVEDELRYVRPLIKEKKIAFCPFIIDDKIKWNDVPDWVSDYLTETIINPFIVANIIKRRIRELVYKSIPYLKQKEELFEGRGTDMEKMKTVYYEKDGLRAVVISGIKHVGRKKFAKHFIQNELISTTRCFYEPAIINLEEYESVDAFCLYLNDFLREYTREETLGIIAKGEKETVEFCVTLLNKWHTLKQSLIIIDNRSIVKQDGDISHWFILLINHSELLPAVHLLVVSAINPKAMLMTREQHLMSHTLSALNLSSLQTLFRKYASICSVNISIPKVEEIIKQLSGYPAQVYNIVDLIKEEGVDFAIKNLPDIQRIYDTDFIKAINLFKYREDSLLLLNILSNIEFMSVEDLSRIYKGEHFDEIIFELRNYSFYETIGSCGEYIRLSPIVNDYINRQRIPLPQEYKEALRKYSRKSFDDLDKETVNLSEYLYALKERLKTNPRAIPSKYLMPSLTLKAMRDNYTQHNYQTVISLAESVIYNRDVTIYEDIKRDYYYWYCLALAREQNSVFFEVVSFFDSNSYPSLFLRGFYCRMQKNLQQAQVFYERAIAVRGVKGDNRFKAEHELVIVYMMQESYDLALDLAQKCYMRNSANTYFIEAYFRCLVKSAHPDIDELKNLIEDMGDSLDQQKDIKKITMEVEYLFYIEHKFDKAIKHIRTVFANHNSQRELIYPIKVLHEICKKQDCISMKVSILKEYGYHDE